MEKKKKILIIAIAAILLIAMIGTIVFLISSNKPEAPSLKDILKSKLNAYKTDLTDSIGSFKTDEDVSEYLINWAKNKEIPAHKDGSGNVIYELEPLNAVTEGNPVVVICSYDSDNMEEHIQEVSSALCISNNLQANGEVKVIFMPENGSDKYGAENLKMNEIPENSQVFFLSDSSSYKVTPVTAGYREYSFTDTVEYTANKFKKAYKISIENCPSVPMGEGSAAIPNPIKQLGNLLANFKSTNLLNEVSSFTGGTAANYTPDSATLTLLISKSDVEKFTKKMDSTIDKFVDKYGDKYPEITYTYTEITEPAEIPVQIISKDDIEDLISLIYTSTNGVYYKDDDGNVLAFTNIGKIETANGQLSIGIAAMGNDMATFDELSESYQIICGLCDAEYATTVEKPMYNGTEITEEFFNSFEDTFTTFTGKESMADDTCPIYTACSVLHEKDEELPILYCGITNKNKHNVTGSIVAYIHQLAGYEG